MSTNQEVFDNYASAGSEDLTSENVFSIGPVIYSYGMHWPIGVRKDGVVYVNADRRSQTSTAHLGKLTKALTQAGQAFQMRTMQQVKDIIEELG